MAKSRREPTREEGIAAFAAVLLEIVEDYREHPERYAELLKEKQATRKKRPAKKAAKRATKKGGKR